MDQILYLSEKDVLKTGVLEFARSVEIVKKAFLLFEEKKALIVEESAIRMGGEDVDQACYCLPAWIGGDVQVCGLKYSSHGGTDRNAKAQGMRIQAAVLLTDARNGRLLGMLNGTRIGAVRTGAVTALALQELAPFGARKAVLCGAGGQAEYQLWALIHALPQLSEIVIWSRSGKKNHLLAARYQEQTKIRLRAEKELSEAVKGADILIAATSAPEPYLTKKHLGDVALYCHIGFHEITREAVNSFSRIMVDTWEEGKQVSGQSLFRYWRAGYLKEERIDATLGTILSGKRNCPRADREHKIMFDAFGLPIFDLSLGMEAYRRAKEQGIGTELLW